MKLGILSIICLSSCGSGDLKETVEFNQKSIRLVVSVDENGRRYINEEKSGCFRRRYKYSIEHIGPISETETLDVLACNKVIGTSPLNYKKKVDWLEAVRLEAIKWLED